MGAALVILLVGLGALATGVLIGRYYVPDDRMLRRSARHGRAYMRALVHHIARDHDTVIAELRKVVEENVEDSEPYFALAALFRARGEHERSIRVHQALAVREGATHRLRQRALYELGLDFRAAGMPRRAARAFEDVLTSEPRHEGALRALCGVYEEQGRFAEAAGAWTRLCRLRGEAPPRRAHHLLCAAAPRAIVTGDVSTAPAAALNEARADGRERRHFLAVAAGWRRRATTRRRARGLAPGAARRARAGPPATWCWAAAPPSASAGCPSRRRAMRRPPSTTTWRIAARATPPARSPPSAASSGRQRALVPRRRRCLAGLAPDVAVGVGVGVGSASASASAPGASAPSPPSPDEPSRARGARHRRHPGRAGGRSASPHLQVVAAEALAPIDPAAALALRPARSPPTRPSTCRRRGSPPLAWPWPPASQRRSPPSCRPGAAPAARWRGPTAGRGAAPTAGTGPPPSPGAAPAAGGGARPGPRSDASA
ncbi:MAG: hypothetical protein HS111_15945 [Kofleriaceae bacterium]|nr:hypothetical protein [Kofleriaceae bacterium]